MGRREPRLGAGESCGGQEIERALAARLRASEKIRRIGLRHDRFRIEVGTTALFVAIDKGCYACEFPAFIGQPLQIAFRDLFVVRG